MDTKIQPTQPARRYKHNQRPSFAVLTSYPPQYRATLAGTEDGKRVEVTGGGWSPAEAEASAWEALRVWALAGRVPA